jgi:hypothetical protein
MGKPFDPFMLAKLKATVESTCIEPSAAIMGDVMAGRDKHLS